MHGRSSKTILLQSCRWRVELFPATLPPRQYKLEISKTNIGQVSGLHSTTEAVFTVPSLLTKCRSTESVAVCVCSTDQERRQDSNKLSPIIFAHRFQTVWCYFFFLRTRTGRDDEWKEAFICAILFHLLQAKHLEPHKQPIRTDKSAAVLPSFHVPRPLPSFLS